MKIQQMFLTPNKYSRPQIKLEKVKKIAVHYTGDPGASAINVRNYFEGLKDSGSRSVSSHFVIGLSGEIIQCIPLDEWSYCTNQANRYSISIECCHADAVCGKFTAATEKSLAELCAFLCEKFKLDPMKDIIRHYDVTGKQCPLYWAPTKYQPASVANARFEAFKNRVNYIIGCGETDKANDDVVPCVPFKVKIIDDALNVRCAPGVANKAVGILHGGVYTIVEVKAVGSALWGRLKSGFGWINVGAKYVKRI
ncbi:MAG: N-acetylmuramoyl-L-alanine amidase family protein [Oscillospiraceae bacterium]